MKRLLLLPLIAACASRNEAEEAPAASRADVTAALYRQLDLVLARAEELKPAAEPAARRERDSSLRLAAEIVLRIVRIDPHADVPRLIERMEAARGTAPPPESGADPLAPAGANPGRGTPSKGESC